MTASERESSFERDVDAYLEALPKLLEKEGKFALIRSARIVEVKPSYESAMAAGRRRYAGKAFLVKEISSKDC